MKKLRSYNDISNALAKLSDEFEIILGRADTPELDFQQKIIAAALGTSRGNPLKDYLNSEDIETAIQILSDIYVASGVRLPPEY